MKVQKSTSMPCEHDVIEINIILMQIPSCAIWSICIGVSGAWHLLGTCDLSPDINSHSLGPCETSCSRLNQNALSVSLPSQ